MVEQQIEPRERDSAEPECEPTAESARLFLSAMRVANLRRDLELPRR